jgi:hypothetical protein
MVIDPVPLPSEFRSSVAAASCVVVSRYRRCRFTIARASAGCEPTMSAISARSTSMSRSRSMVTSRSSATRRVSSWDAKNVASTPNTSVIRSSTATVSGRTSCSI